MSTLISLSKPHRGFASDEAVRPSSRPLSKRSHAPQSNVGTRLTCVTAEIGASIAAAAACTHRVRQADALLQHVQRVGLHALQLQQQQQEQHPHLRNAKRNVIEGTSSPSFTRRLSANWPNTITAASPSLACDPCVIVSVNWFGSSTIAKPMPMISPTPAKGPRD
jgi:hypothetical protein